LKVLYDFSVRPRDVRSMAYLGLWVRFRLEWAAFKSNWGVLSLC
jgi:hypothetical protein